MQDLLERIRRLDGRQEELDAIYTEMADVLKAGLVYKLERRREGNVGSNLGPLSKLLGREAWCFHKAEADWLKCKDPKEGDRGLLQNEEGLC